MPAFPSREVPPELAALHDLALDLRWTWSHEADALWLRVDEEVWRRTQNPWIVLQNAKSARLRDLAADVAFVTHLNDLAAARRAYLEGPCWFAKTLGDSAPKGVAYFSMEFGLSEALPLYAGGLGLLAGDVLKTASDLGIPVVGVGLLFQEGYFRQTIDAAGRQHETYPYNEPSSLPIEPLADQAGGWLHIPIDLPGRRLLLRVWQALVGRTKLYLLDSNDPLNSPHDRGITGKLYGGDRETRLLQEIALGFGGWRLAEMLHPETEICHLNEGHAAFVVLERAHRLARRARLSFTEALWASRAGNVFTTHTAVDAAFDRFPEATVAPYLQSVMDLSDGTGVSLAQLLALGRGWRHDGAGDFDMSCLALRGALKSFGVSRLHGHVSRGLFQPLFARWPQEEVPVGHVTNGIHVPSWDSVESDKIWTAACTKERWRQMPDTLSEFIEPVPDGILWAMRAASRQRLVGNVRDRLKTHLGGRGHAPETVAQADTVFDPNILTLGFARRFTGYKRLDLLLRDPQRLIRLLTDARRPVQLVIAGKAHPDDEAGKATIQAWLALAQRPELRRHLVFLEDYDIGLAQELVEGVDVWLNTPRRPLEACGTSGMKVLVNGGLNLSERDGWWEEAYAPDHGWAIGGENGSSAQAVDARDAEALYRILEAQVVPEFYDRDAAGIPRAWVARIRRSMSVLTPAYSSTRMMRAYLATAYLPGTEAFRQRLLGNAERAKAMAHWAQRIEERWAGLHLGPPKAAREGEKWAFTAPVYLGEMAVEDVRVELYAEPPKGEDKPEIVELLPRDAISGAVNSYIYGGYVPATRPETDFTLRLVPAHPGVRVPTEMPHILWQR